MLALLAPVASQDEAMVDAMAAVLSLEDRQLFDAAVLANAAHHPEPMVRRRAALAVGRIGDSAGTTILIEMLEDPVQIVRQDAAFALGLLGDRFAIGYLRELVLNSYGDDMSATQVEAVTALTRLGGSEAAEVLEDLLSRWIGRIVAGDEIPSTVSQALFESWRLGTEAPEQLLLQYAELPLRAVRLPAVYSLSRLRAVAGANVFVDGLDDTDDAIRALSALALNADFADAAGLDRNGTARRLVPLIEDNHPRVRINTLRSLGSYKNPTYSALLVNGLSDADPNARVQAITALGLSGGDEAERLLQENVNSGPFAERRQALLGLAAINRDRAIVRAAGWITSDDWLLISTGIEALGIIAGDTAEAWLVNMLHHDDGRIVGRAFSAVARIDSIRATALARGLLEHPDPVVRTLATNQIRGSLVRTDLELLTRAYGLSLRDGISDARIAIARAIGQISREDLAFQGAVEEFLALYPTCSDYLVRSAVIDSFPAAALKWGGVAPILTGKDIADYRDIARRLILPAEQNGVLPGIVVETEYGSVDISLFAADAPITVDALLQLVDRHYFDGGTWHRVVPNFVIQDGDPRGDGWGGPGFSLRDEISRRRYGRGTVGMALSGPHTGGSQFFITHSPQPHLDGTYAVVGQVDSGMDIVDRITQGDGIRTIRRR